jgi:hypothetical protein
MHRDFKEFIEALNLHHVEYVIVGGYALAFHGIPRYTGGMDFLVRVSAENAAKLERALMASGFDSAGIGANDFLLPDHIVQLGFPPFRIDIITSISGVEFEEIWSRRIAAELDGAPVYFIDRESFITNKRATGRKKDQADLEALGAE